MAYDFYVIGEALLVLALLGLIGVIIWLAMTVLHAKDAVMTAAPKLYKRPLNAGKNLAAVVKGLVQQETVRAKRVGVTVKGAAESVKVAAGDIGTAAKGVHPEELKPALSSVGSLFKVAGLAARLSRSAPKQRAGRN